MRKYIGIDIGKAGAYYVMGEDGSEIDRGKMPMIKDKVDWHQLNEILEPYEGFNGMIVYEKLGVIFGSSKKTAFSMGEQYGAVRMCCISNAIRYTEVPAKKWQAEIFDGQVKIYRTGSKTKVDTKAMALMAAKRLFPKVNLLMTEKSSVPHDGLVDALLMAEYARRKFPR
jgi:hypothetical protein